MLNAKLHPKDINKQTQLMMTASSAKVQMEAANSLLTHLKPSETKKGELEKYRSAILEGKVSAFMHQYMLRITSNEEKLIQDSGVRWHERTRLLSYKSRFNFYITTDFATKAKQHNDFSGISV